jgi:hypothetical protein
MRPEYVLAHDYSIRNKASLLKSVGYNECGCFHCLEIFSLYKIQDWVDIGEDGKGQTALCPFCEIDSVIGHDSGYPITKDFLTKMQSYWFGEVT